MKSKIIIISLLSLLLLTTAHIPAFAFGPSIHMREADHYITYLEQHPQGGIEHNPDYLRTYRAELRLGSIWPDIARVVTDKAGSRNVDQGLVDPHNRHFNYFLLEDALDSYPNDPWKVAFALGNLIHNVGDIIAQDMLSQHMGVRAHLGGLDIFVGFFDDHAGGEVEALIEGGYEFVRPALYIYNDMASHFIFDTDGRTRLLEAYNYYITKWDEFFGANKAASREGFEEVVYILSDIKNNFPANSGSPEMYRFAASGFSELSVAAISIDWDEVIRLLTGPVITAQWWDIYYDEGYFDLSSFIISGFEEGQGYFDHFPNWSAKMMKSGCIQALSYYLPGDLTVEDGRFLSDLYWTDDDSGQTITSIDADTPPSSVTIVATFYDVLGRTLTNDDVTLVVRADSPGQETVAYATADVGVDPMSYDVNTLTSMSVTFDPAASIANGASGYFVELINGDDQTAVPYFTTDWSVYEQITQIDMTKAVYTAQYSTYDHWPYSLKINGGATSFFRNPILNFIAKWMW